MIIHLLNPYILFIRLFFIYSMDEISGYFEVKEDPILSNPDIDKLFKDISCLDCFHEQILSEDANEILSIPGDYVIKINVKSDGKKEIRLCIYDTYDVIEIPLRGKWYEKDKKYTLTFDGRVRSSSIIRLLEKHNDREIALKDGKKILLMRPIGRQKWELKRNEITTSKKIGEGEFGEIMKGSYTKRSGKILDVAVKIFKRTDDKEKNQKAINDLHQEGAIMRKLKHVNVVRSYGMVLEMDSIMLVMELVSGGGLNDYLYKNKGKVSIKDKAHYCHDIASGLAYIHTLGLIHRDIALRNVLLDTVKNMAKLSDFGLTRKIEKYTVTANDKIPARWMAPEVLLKREYTKASDVYSFSIALWEIFSDGTVLPFHHLNNQDIRTGLLHPLFRPAFPRYTPDEIVTMAEQCWKGDPKERPNLVDCIESDDYLGKFSRIDRNEEERKSKSKNHHKKDKKKKVDNGRSKTSSMNTVSHSGNTSRSESKKSYDRRKKKTTNI